MTQPPRKMGWLVWGGLAVVIAIIGAAFIRSKLETPERSLPIIGQIPDFKLTNQNNEVVTLADLQGKVWVADIIFTRCPAACPRMTRRFAELQAAFPATGPVRLVSLTTDPENDTPVVLKNYANLFQADGRRWWFLTGDKMEIRNLAVNDFKFQAVERPPGDRTVPADLFLHSEWFALVDQKGRTRGWVDKEGRTHATFESDVPEHMEELRRAIKQLLSEPPS